MTAPARTYVVGGVIMPRPFKIRRLGHFGLWSANVDAAQAFYVDTLGLRLTDTMSIDFPDGVRRQIFTAHGSDHHSFVLGDARIAISMDDRYARGITVNQLSFQVGTLAEIADAQAYFGELDVPMQRGGRDSPGSNWVVYMYDPDGMRTELFYGMEQIGWDRLSKPDAMRYQGTFELPPRPQPSEETELQRAVERGIDLLTGRRSTDVTPDAFDVGGIMLPRPFKVTKVGPAHLFVEHVAASEQFYVEQLGLQRVEEATFRGHRVVFLRHGTDHHSVGLFPIELRSELGLDPRTKLMSFGLQVGSYQQLRDAVAYLRGKGIDCIDLPPALYPGIDYAAHIIDPDGHCICLYYYMEQVGWDGQPRPKSKRPPTTTPWPQAVDALSDTYVDQLFQGPLG